MENLSLYENCTLCPNSCGVDRTKGQKGRCGQTDTVRIAWSGLHRGEEPPVSGKKGSGMIFFCGCSLHCQYCQNFQISHKDAAGIDITINQLANLMLELQAFGAATINLVTGTHFIPSITTAIETAKSKGLTLPIVWNSSGFETVPALKLIDPYLDLYLIDVKTLDHDVASQFCALPRYADDIIPVMKFLKKRHPVSDIEHCKGILVRHLVFPGTLNATLKFLTWYADNFKDCSNLSLMVQFVPPQKDPGFAKMTDSEYQLLLDKLDTLGINGFVQERSDNEILWIPDFNRDQPFPDSFADPLPYFLSLKNKKNA